MNRKMVYKSANFSMTECAGITAGFADPAGLICPILI